MFSTKNLLILIVRNSIIALIFIAISIVGMFYIKSKIEHITDSIVLKHKLEAELKNRNNLLETLDKDIKIIGNNNVIINNAFVPSNNISNFTNTLDELALKNKIPQVYHFETPVTSGSAAEFPTSTISYSNNLTSDISNFSSYLKKFEILPYFTKIDGLRITSQDIKGIAGASTINLSATLLTQTIQ